MYRLLISSDLPCTHTSSPFIRTLLLLILALSYIVPAFLARLEEPQRAVIIHPVFSLFLFLFSVETDLVGVVYFSPRPTRSNINNSQKPHPSSAWSSMHSFAKHHPHDQCSALGLFLPNPSSNIGYLDSLPNLPRLFPTKARRMSNKVSHEQQLQTPNPGLCFAANPLAYPLGTSLPRGLQLSPSQPRPTMFLNLPT